MDRDPGAKFKVLPNARALPRSCSQHCIQPRAVVQSSRDLSMHLCHLSRLHPPLVVLVCLAGHASLAVTVLPIITVASNTVPQGCTQKAMVARTKSACTQRPYMQYTVVKTTLVGENYPPPALKKS